MSGKTVPGSMCAGCLQVVNPYRNIHSGMHVDEKVDMIRPAAEFQQRAVSGGEDFGKRVFEIPQEFRYQRFTAVFCRQKEYGLSASLPISIHAERRHVSLSCDGDVPEPTAGLPVSR
ncbi:MAG: hypothetical protein ACYDHM_02100 [Acidiferrobacterales bacterium]